MLIDSKYNVLEKLGSGNLGTVYKVENVRTGKLYRLKEFQKISAEIICSKFSPHEMHFISRLEHPNLVRVLNFGFNDKNLYCLSEFYEGKTLNNYSFRPVNINALYDIIVQCLYALDALHAKNIFHKDLKPTNILYIESGDYANLHRIKLIDYGFNKIDSDRTQQSTNEALSYIAPELLSSLKDKNKDSLNLSPQGDYYSLGVTLYRLTTGILPFSNEQIASIMSGSKNIFSPKFVCENNPFVPELLGKFIMQLIERDPKARFHNVQEAIEYVNKMAALTNNQKKNIYPFSHKFSLLQSFKADSYIIRDNYVTLLKDYAKLIGKKNGKLITLIGSDGIGKDSILTLFKYHMLNQNFTIYDIDNNNVSSLIDIFSNFSATVTTEKMLIIIRKGEIISDDIFKLINDNFANVLNNPILIIIASNNPSKMKTLKQSAQIKVEDLTLEETRSYIKKMVKKELTDDFVYNIWNRSSGNPYFIRELLIDILQKNELTDFNFTNLILPDHLLKLVQKRFLDINDKTFKFIRLLSIINTPINMEFLKDFLINNKNIGKVLLKNILDVNKSFPRAEDLYKYLQEAGDFDIIRKHEGFVYFSFNECKEILLNSSTKKDIKYTSQLLIEYYDKKDTYTLDEALGIIKNAEICKDYKAIKKYRLIALNFYSKCYDQINAFKQIYEICNINLQKKITVTEIDLQHELSILFEKAELTGKHDDVKKLKLRNRIITESNSETANLMKNGHLYRNTAIDLLIHKNYDKAKENFYLCKNIWEKINYIKMLGPIYNDIGDVYLRQGILDEALINFKKAEIMSQKVNNTESLAFTITSMAELYIKKGRFDEAEKLLQKAQAYNFESLKHKININIALIKSKTISFNQFYNFLEKEYPDILNQNYNKIDPLLKSYIIFLHEIGDRNKILSILQSDLDFISIKEEDFYYQILAMAASLKGDYTTAINNYLVALSHCNVANSNYSKAIINIYIAQCYCNVIKPEIAVDYLNEAERIINKYDYKYWHYFKEIVSLKLMLLDNDVAFRKIIRKAFFLLKEIENLNYFLLEIDLYSIIIQVYTDIKATKIAEAKFTIYSKMVRDVSRNLPEQEKNKYQLIKNALQTKFIVFDCYNVFPRKVFNFAQWNKEIIELLTIEAPDRIKFILDQKIENFFTPFYYAIIIYKANANIKNISPTNCDVFLEKSENRNFNVFNMIAQNYDENIKQFVFKQDNCVRNTVICQLKLKYSHIGFFILQDGGEMPFTKDEMKHISNFIFHLNALLIRTAEFEEMNQKIDIFSRFINVSSNITQIYDARKLEYNFVQNIINLSDATRGLLLKASKTSGYDYAVALDNKGHIINNPLNVSMNIVMDVNMSKQPIYIENSNTEYEQKSIYAIDKPAVSLYCAPILIDIPTDSLQLNYASQNITDNVYAILYIDNYGEENCNLIINEEIMALYIKMANIAVKNAITYQSLMNKNQEFLNLDNMKTEFISIVSHELNTPLFTLHANINRLKRYVSEYDFDINEILSKVEKNSGKLMETIQSIFELNRYNSISSLIKEYYDIEPILNELINTMKSSSSFRNIKFNFHIQDDIKYVNIDRDAFQLMINNILANAVRFTQDYGNIIVAVKKYNAPNEQKNKQEHILICIKDNGIGIPDSEKDEIFKPFYELGEMLSHKSGNLEFKSGGLGVGLAICKRIAELHHGSIWVESDEKTGSTFFVALPAT